MRRAIFFQLWILLLLAGGAPRIRPSLAAEVPTTHAEIWGSHLPAVSVQQLSPWERRLRFLSHALLKDIRRWSIRVSRLARRTLRYWLDWGLGAAVLLLMGAFISAIDLRLLKVWRRAGVRRASSYALIGTVVFFRLLLERRGRVPTWPRLLLLASLLYGLVTPDLIGDRIAIFGWVDDLTIVGVAARLFVRRCPMELVEQHATHVRDVTAGRFLPSSHATDGSTGSFSNRS